MKLDGNQASIREAIDAGLLAGAVTLVWQAGEVLQVNELGYRDVDAGSADATRHDLPHRVDDQARHRRRGDDPGRGRQARADRSGDEVAAGAGRHAGAGRPRGPLDRTVPPRRPITVDDLMTHRSGLAYSFSVSGPLSRAYGRLSFRQDQDRWLAELAALPLVHQPGDRLTYSHATDVLGIALSRIEGKPLADVLSERIFGPLGMADTGFAVEPDGRRRAATMYKLDENMTLRHDAMGPRRSRSAVLHRRCRPVVHRRRLSAVRPDAAGRRQRSTVCGCCPSSPYD